MTDLTIPNTFVVDTPSDADDVNANFAAIATLVNSTGVPKVQSSVLVVPIVTALPGSPYDGQEIRYQTAAMATAGYSPLALRYRASSPYSSKWDVIGGGPWSDMGSDRTDITVTTYGSPVGAPSIAIPVAMTAHVVVDAYLSNTSTSSIFMAADGAGITAADIYAAAYTASVATGIVSACKSRPPEVSVLTAGTLSTKVRVSGGTGTTNAPTLTVYPIRVG